ncbi:hypothetical protein [Flexivirga oryzae]|uniref:DUF4386 family protein n=1 Tax=Flexivirga oryzae TaxID=1794944 RepID=A0A839N4F1_9MICO|nr:hypothetical protein [Flexivirga oryzae]MBB2892640.1 hypothetical protein [Flexivirga oryzae]
MATPVAQQAQPISSTPPPALLGRRVGLTCLVVAPLLGVTEAAISPLRDSSTAADLAAIDANRGVFVLSVLVGLLGTVLFVPAFVWLAQACVGRSPVAARIGGAVAVISMMGFTGVRAIQGVELQAVQNGLPTDTAAGLIDDMSGNPIGVVVLLMFLGGTVVGVVSLAVATWRARLARPASVLLLAFPLLDLGLAGKAGTVLAHVVLFGALCWFAVSQAGRSGRVGHASS